MSGYKTPETRVKDEVEKYLKGLQKMGVKIGFWRISAPNMTNFPDLLLVFKGRFIGIELKKDSHTKPREGQILQMENIRKCGGIAEAISSVQELKTILERVEET